MRIGVDFRAMQMGHELRGIGEVLRSACAELDNRLPSTDEIVAFTDTRGDSVATLLDTIFSSGRTTSEVGLPYTRRREKWRRLFDSLSPVQTEAIQQSCDVLLQFDPLLGAAYVVPTVVVVHDQIPLVLGDRYPHIYWPHLGPALRAGMAPRVAADRAARRTLYERALSRALRRASRVIANSAYTAGTTEAFAREHGIADLRDRMEVTLLGHRPPDTAPVSLGVMDQARLEGLGLTEERFLLFVGGADDRRRIDWLVAAFNDLRARGFEGKLVLAGDTFITVDTIGNARAREAVATSSYRDDICLLGYVNHDERTWLYRHAAAFAFPSEMEGFGLPVLESLAHGCPVVAFDNSSLPEVAGPNALLVDAGWRPLARGIDEVLRRSDEDKAADAAAGQAWAEGFTWDPMATALAEAIDAQR